LSLVELAEFAECAKRETISPQTIHWEGKRRENKREKRHSEQRETNTNKSIE